jgi:LmbE family N-acetylglucosaminyl deacetylase
MTDLGLTWGVLPADTFERVLVFSPHFDDAAMGAGHLLLAHPGATVCTVFAGPPDRYPDEPTEWDALGGFQPGDDVVAMRREEDLAALAVLGAQHHWLEFVDHQYLEPDARATADDVAPALAAVVEHVAPTAVVLPLGLANPDHVVTHDAGVQVALARPDLAWFAYEDAGYKHIPGMMAWRVAKLFKSDLWPTPMIVPTNRDHARKRASIECYTSQLAPLRADHALDARLDGAVAEQFWQLAPPPPGWERMRDAV